MCKKILSCFIITLFLSTLACVFSPGLIWAQDERKEENDKRPERLITMAAEYPGVQVPLEQDVSMDLIFRNRGKSDEDVVLSIAEQPKGWKVRLKTYRYTVTGLHVSSGTDKTVTFEAEPGKDTAPGTYDFRIDAQTRDGVFKMSRIITVEVTEKDEGKKEAKGVKLTTSYPVLRGPSDARFEFSLEVDSKLDKEAVFELSSQAPEGWEINFKPAYESKFISSLRLRGNQSSSVAVEVKPPHRAPAGEYPVTVRVSSGDARSEAVLAVILTGTYGLEVGTPSGLLSLEARQGKTANMSFYVKNTGSAANNEINFVTFKPENWKIEFKPEKIGQIEPGDLKQVEVFITSHEDALVGDYSVNINVEGEKAQKPMELRVTVKASTAWGWVGIGLIFFVVAGLTGLFRFLGRR